MYAEDKVSAKDFGRLVREHVMNMEVARVTQCPKPLVSVTRYLEAGYARTRSYIKLAVKYPNFARGINHMAQLRIGAFWTSRKAANAHLIDVKYKDECPCCGALVPETDFHMLLECAAWNGQRDESINKVLATADAPLLAVGAEEMKTILLGGEVDGQNSSKLKKLFLFGSGPKVRDGNKVDAVPGLSSKSPWFAAVAAFLTHIQASRWELVWASAQARP
jgi:hypothetical protein